MTYKMHTIWDNINYDDQFDAYKEDFEQDDPDWYAQQDEDSLFSMFYEQLYEDLDCFIRPEMDKVLSEEIICLGNLGLWYGHVTGYKIIESQNLADCFDFENDEYRAWWLDNRGDLCSEGYNHDGRSSYLYRMFRPNLSDKKRETFLEKVYNGTCTRRDITRYTVRLGDIIGKIYGWEYPTRSKYMED